MNDKDFKEMASGFLTGLAPITAWNNQQNPPPVYVEGVRVHHGAIGALLIALGLIGRQSQQATEEARSTANFLIGLGGSLALDDLHDIQDW